MINEILTRFPSQEFLNKYPSDRWKDIIADVVEIGILNLRNSFGTDEFSKNEIQGVLNDLRYYTPGSQDFPVYKSYENEQCKKMSQQSFYSTKNNQTRMRREEPYYDNEYNYK